MSYVRRAHLALSCVLLAACAADVEGGLSSGNIEGAVETPASDCDRPAMGCACAGHRPPIACNLPSPSDSEVCYEGTRHCEGGVWSECRNVRVFRKPGDVTAALIDPLVIHPQCSDCDANCYRIEDTLDPSSGPLTGSLFSGVSYDVSGSGVALTGTPTAPPPDGPAGALLLSVGTSGAGVLTHEVRFHPQDVDVYFLLDRSASTTLSLQNFAFQFGDNGDLVPADARCIDDDDTPRPFGISGALSCLLKQPETGLGLFRDIPFDPYAVDASLPSAEQQADAFMEVAFRHLQDMDPDSTSVLTALSALGASESSGDPDLATSLVPALHALATGNGMWFGYDRPEVPDAPGCAAGRGGYPCFRDGTDSIVVAVTDAPMHNGPWVTANPPQIPDPDFFDYGYGFGAPPTNLTVRNGTSQVITPVPAGNDDLATAFALTTDATPILDTFTGTTAGLSPSADEFQFSSMCNGSVTSPDAMFSFRVAGAPGGTADILLSTEGSSFDTTLAVYDGPPGGAVTSLPMSDNMNGTFATAAAMPDALRSVLAIDGDTSAASMAPDYQGSLFFDQCVGETANSLAPDAIYAFSVSGSDPVPVQVSVDMGAQQPVVAIYDVMPTGQEWPVAAGTATSVSGNDEISNAQALPDPAGNYFSVTGDTSSLTAKFDQSALGGAACNPDSTAKDAVFRIDVTGSVNLRFDTEGSVFDTVLSLHDAPPLTNAGASLTRLAADTHMNGNEDATSAWPTGPIDGLAQVFQGDTAAMAANVGDPAGCGAKGSCPDAVYRFEVLETTTIRLGAEGTGWEPSVALTRHDPSKVQGELAPVALGGHHTCALSEGQVYCWGRNDVGQLGSGSASATPSTVPVLVPGLVDVIQVAAGAEHTCAVTEDGRVHCWGSGTGGELGNSPAVDAASPYEVLEIGPDIGDLGRAVQVSLGRRYTCALLEDGQVTCWGDNSLDQLGRSAASPAAPGLVDGSNTYTSLAAGRGHVCAIAAAGTIWCWGDGSSGQLGDGSTANNPAPDSVTGLPVVPVVATQIMVGEVHSCALLSSGRVVCWGSKNNGRLGNGETSGIATDPQPVRNFDADADGADDDGYLGGVTSSFGVGAAHTCVRSGSGFVLCWGANGDGQLGQGDTLDRARPALVDGVLDAMAVASGNRRSCALTDTGRLLCWGHGLDGKLGDGDASDHNERLPVAAQPGGGTPVSFGAGYPASGTTAACRSSAQAPESGCSRDYYSGTGDDHAYFFCPGQPRRWADAAGACRAVDMELAEINEPDENLFVGNRVGSDSWVGFRRILAASDHALTNWVDFASSDNELAWFLEGETCVYDSSGNCQLTFYGDFRGPMVGLSDALGAVWDADADHPGSEWGQNCTRMAAATGKWVTGDCGAVAQPATCALSWGSPAVSPFCQPADFAAAHASTLAAWMPSVASASQVVTESPAGELALPWYAGGAEHGYVCEEETRLTDVKVDPGDYYLTVKGIEDGTGCGGAYDLTIADLGSPSGGFMDCNDNADSEVSTSAIERTLTTGSYYLVLKGKSAGEEGQYNLTVRDLDAVSAPQVACEVGNGSAPATASITAMPGTTYYAMVKGDTQGDQGPYSLRVRDTDPATTNFVGCDDDGGIGGASAITMTLATDTDYYAVLKGAQVGEEGAYRLTVGGAAASVEQFDPPDYTGTLAALDGAGVHVATVLTCSTGSCPEAEEQADTLATDLAAGSVRGSYRVASDPTEVASVSVEAVLDILAVDRVVAVVDWAPSGNTDAMTGADLFEATIATVPLSNNHCVGNDGTAYTDCRPGAATMFDVTIRELSTLGVPAGPLADGSYQFTLRVEGQRGAETIVLDERPLIVKPSLLSLVGAYSSGFYAQDTDGQGCAADTSRRPSWDELVFDADVLPDTQITLSVCAADTPSDLDGCPAGTSGSSGFERVVTLSAGTDQGIVCTPATELMDCPGGYCSPYTDRCIYIEGTACVDDMDCPGALAGSCHTGPNAVTLGTTCLVTDRTGLPAEALQEHNYRHYLRVQADLESLGSGSRTPSLYYWEARYFCRSVE